MFKELPSLSGFQPRFYTGGPIHWHLPFLYDLASTLKPRAAVVVGLGEGDAFFTLCQAADSVGEKGHCLAVHRSRPGAPEANDARWREAVESGAEVYGDRAKFLSDADALRDVAERSVDFLLIDDSDVG